MLRVLFLCAGNSCRSQLAEGWANHLISDAIQAFSVGTESHSPNQIAIKILKEVCVDNSGNK